MYTFKFGKKMFLLYKKFDNYIVTSLLHFPVFINCQLNITLSINQKADRLMLLFILLPINRELFDGNAIGVFCVKNCVASINFFDKSWFLKRSALSSLLN